jgi:histidine kinase/DNA gyrase B/HSP90-like ATPase
VSRRNSSFRFSSSFSIWSPIVLVLLEGYFTPVNNLTALQQSDYCSKKENAQVSYRFDAHPATPSKRLYHSIIADYDLNKGICELIDNALDMWVKKGRSFPLSVNVTLDQRQQRIGVVDNAGGVGRSDLSSVVAPGHTGNVDTDEIIGIFGVGTKRAVVALAQEVRIRTREEIDTLQLEFDDSWIKDSDDWRLPVYRVSDIPRGTTRIDLLGLRSPLTDESASKLAAHLGAVYATFLIDKNVSITLNNKRISPVTFDNWAYPPNFAPRHYKGVLKTLDGEDLRVSAIAGLALESSPAGGEYGAYFYCNDRLIARALKTIDVGFATGLSGKPHADISLARVIVSLHGVARLMPWNSSKSDINTSHEVFVALRNWLLQVVKGYTSLSRRLSKFEGGWPEQVFKYETGTITEVIISDFPSVNTAYLPPLPESKPRFARVVWQANKSVAQDKPWTTGLLESVIAVDWILKQHFDQRNRIALILLDSTLEITFKEYLVNESGVIYNDARLLSLFSNRHQVHQEIRKYVKIAKTVWGKIDHYYQMRCQLIHRRASVAVSDTDIAGFKDTVQRVLKKLFKLKFGD